MRKTEKRREKYNIILSVVVMLIMATLVVFLSNKLAKYENEDESIANDTQTEEKEKLTIWYYDSLYKDYVNYVCETYAKENDIEVSAKMISADGYLEAINQASVSDDEYPDVYILPEEMLEKAYLGGLAQINEHDKQYSEKNYSSVALSSIVYKNKKVAYPLSFDIGFLVYNKAYTKETPDSFDDILKYAENFDGENYPEVKTVLEWNPKDILYNYGFVGAYMECGGANGDDESICSVNNDNTKKALKYYTKLQEFFSIDMESVNDNTVKNDFVKGRIVYTIAGMDYYNYFVQKGVDFVVADFPNLSKELESKTLATTSVVVVNPFSNYLRKAEDLAMYMTYDEPEMVYELTGRLSPANYKYEDDNLNIILECYGQSSIMPKLMNTLDYKQRLQIVLNDIWNGGSIKDNLNKLEEEMSIQMEK